MRIKMSKIKSGEYKCQYETFETSIRHETAIYFLRADANIFDNIFIKLQCIIHKDI